MQSILDSLVWFSVQGHTQVLFLSYQTAEISEDMKIAYGSYDTNASPLWS